MECRGGGTYQGRYEIGRPNSCTSTKPTHLTTGVSAILTQDRNALQHFLSVSRIEQGTYCTTSESSTSGPHYTLHIDHNAVVVRKLTLEYFQLG